MLPKSSIALRDAINYLLISKGLREEYGQNGRERVEREFTKEKMANEVRHLYEKIINSEA